MNHRNNADAAVNSEVYGDETEFARRFVGWNRRIHTQKIHQMYPRWCVQVSNSECDVQSNASHSELLNYIHHPWNSLHHHPVAQYAMLPLLCFWTESWRSTVCLHQLQTFVFHFLAEMGFIGNVSFPHSVDPIWFSATHFTVCISLCGEVWRDMCYKYLNKYRERKERLHNAEVHFNDCSRLLRSRRMSLVVVGILMKEATVRRWRRTHHQQLERIVSIADSSTSRDCRLERCDIAIDFVQWRRWTKHVSVLVASVHASVMLQCVCVCACVRVCLVRSWEHVYNQRSRRPFQWFRDWHHPEDWSDTNRHLWLAYKARRSSRPHAVEVLVAGWIISCPQRTASVLSTNLPLHQCV